MESNNPKYVIDQFHNRVVNHELDDKIYFDYRSEGGIPSQRFEEGFKLSGSGDAWVMHHEVVRSIPRREAELKLDDNETEELFRLITAGARSLLPMEDAGFIPDSVVGTLTMEVEDAKTILFFLALERDRLDQDQMIAPEMIEALERLREITRQALREIGAGEDA